MTNLIESLKKGPVMIMTLKCETEFPKALKNLMLSMRMQGEVIYKGFPVIDEGQEYWWVQLHLYKDKEYDHNRNFGYSPIPRCIHHSLTPRDVLHGQQ
jgi:hypothetical protein